MVLKHTLFATILLALLSIPASIHAEDLKDKWRTIKAPLIYIPRQQVLNFKTALFASNVNTFEYLRKR